ncbi:glycogen debranching N-terminal domain-containing protein [Arthrobacter sp. StoSoilB5]|uniref:amylo-alpha-1,6-glucosidase n=1 Tax=Arthrobacter sp. StoSoilB5 TaxID=2830992 RepID=UPI001CC7F7C8|nr:glycogen debranching N-terminal domain-containing protein [Arthrobacter sp. StoSoilB5]BCW44935.1 amylo-alpha-1,6-glucosidase [Arthrobacter sp. StoSoilB5]
MAGWNIDTAAGSLSATVSLVEGSNFCISLPNGDIHPEQPHGVFHEDTRILSRWVLTVNGQPIESLTAETKQPYRVAFAGRVPGSEGYADGPLLVYRLREVGIGISEKLTVRNFSSRPVDCHIVIDVGTDFADLFEVKESRIQRRWKTTWAQRSDSVTIAGEWEQVRKSVVINAKGAEISPGILTYREVIPPHGHWTKNLSVVPEASEGSAPDFFEHPAPGEMSARDRRRQEWVAKIPVLQIGSKSIERTLRRSYDDLGALRIDDPQHPERVVVAAGAPWFMTLFGRDSIWASGMALPVDPSLALGTLQTLADRQGRTVDPMSEEEPGKILHEVRLGVSSGLALGGKSAYYGSIDATPLFVALLGEVSRWGFAPELIEAVLPHADRALDWIRDYGDRDGDGFVEYQRLNDQGLINQGWKDSWDGINFADGSLAEPPIALCEVQAYVHGAYAARAWMAYDAGDYGKAAEMRQRAARLKRQFNEMFWLPDKGYYAVALDRDKRPVDACASNMGQCLWFGVVDEDKAPLVVKRLMSPEMYSGWGIRTLASDMGAYNPVSYHNGSVWPHDNALIVAGLLRYGFIEEAKEISTALFEAASYSGGRLPELFCGFSREEFSDPVPYPTACSPQAWAATTPIQLITSLMRYDPDVSAGALWLDPVLPDTYGGLHIRHAPMGQGRISIDISNSDVSVKGLPAGMSLQRGRRPWITDLVDAAPLEAKGHGQPAEGTTSQAPKRDEESG